MSRSSENVKAWRRRTKENLVKGFGGGCQNCGYNKCYNSLAFHHKDPTKKDFSFGAVRANSISWNKIVEEIKKCCCLCNNCHGEVHAGITTLPTDLKEFDVSATAQFEKDIKSRARKERKKCISCGKNTNSSFLSDVKYCVPCSGINSRKIVWPSPEEISKLVWEMPTQKVAEKLGVSDVAIGKFCKKQNISKPPRGYWTKPTK